MASSKPVRLTVHAQAQMLLRGADEAEVNQVIRSGTWEPAQRGKLQARQRFDFNAPSPVTQRNYRFKTVEAVFVDEPDAIVVVTVKVYYSNEEQSE